jgi:hypothetical protein
MEILEATALEPRGGANSIWLYWLLPKMPVEIYYYDADEEYPCMVKFKYDKTALTFVPFETLVVMNSCLIKEIIAIREAL